jgi:hypothetical protein
MKKSQEEDSRGRLGMIVMIDEDQHQEVKPREESFSYTPERES